MAIVLVIGITGGILYWRLRDSPLTVSVPAETTAGHVTVQGRTEPLTPVLVQGGSLPVTAVADDAGDFSVDVALRPDETTTLTVAAVTGEEVHRAEVTTSQRTVEATGQVVGRVIDIESQAPVAGATVAYGARTVAADASGQFTLDGMPEGLVAVSAKADGYLIGWAYADVVGGQSTATILAQRLAPPITIDATGSTVEGEGWRLTVPPGAVTGPTEISLTPLITLGALDAMGLPVLELSPRGLTFHEPITLSVDPPVGSDHHRRVAARHRP